jgi:anthranilate synthase component I
MNHIDPDLPKFRDLARDRRVIPVMRTLLADGWSAVGLYRALCGTRPGTFLLESAEHGRSWSRYSFIGVRSAAMLSAVDGKATWVGHVPKGLPLHGDPTEVLRESMAALHTMALPDLPPLTGGFVGYFSYDMVRDWEAVPDDNPDSLNIPEMGFLLATDLAVVDHAHGTVHLIANAVNFDGSDARVDDAWRDAVTRLDDMEERLREPQSFGVQHYDASVPLEIDPRTSQTQYLADVERAKEYIRAGDAFQIVLSQRFESPCSADALDVYRILRTSNPSPYMYMMRMPTFDDLEATAFDIVGSSPEALITVNRGHCVVHPIAGTRPRGGTPQEDVALGEELLADPKERSEHVMLVDLARNDLGRVCDPGSVQVVEFMQIERYSHVMHVVSTVTGELKSGESGLDAIIATFPAGTLSGAPKTRAMAIIDELELIRRGIYGGCVGYIDFAGNVDTAIAIRTAVIADGTAYVQAGAGIVADSDPQTEFDECVNKAAAVLRAVGISATLKDAGP